jgi:hypothetical protein
MSLLSPIWTSRHSPTRSSATQDRIRANRLRATRSFASTIKEFREAVLALAVFVAIMTCLRHWMFGSGFLALIDNGGNMPEGAAVFAASRGALQLKRPAPIPNERTSDRLQ